MRGVKTCPQCQTGNGPRERVCRSCGHEFTTLMERKRIAAVAKTRAAQTDQPARPEISPSNFEDKNKFKELRNLVHDHEKTIGKLEDEINKLRQQIQDWQRWKAEKIYNSALNKMIEALRVIIEKSDVETLSKVLMETQAYMNPLGEQFFHKDGTAKVLAVAPPIEESSDV